MINLKDTMFNCNEFKHFLRDSFDDGRVNCELRLSDDEVTYIKKHFPLSTLKLISEKESVYAVKKVQVIRSTWCIESAPIVHDLRRRSA